MINIKQLSLALFLTTSFTATNLLAAKPSIVGQWQCQMSYMGNNMGAAAVSFDSNGQTVMGGQPFSYTLQGNSLQISNGAASDSYTYQLNDNKLTLSYRDGSVFDCNRQASAAGPGGLLQMGGSQKQSAQAAGNEWQLNGTFCHYSGSSSLDSSYSTTSRIYFDGQGRWSMGSESSFSSNAGSGYSGGGVDNSGSYRINGGQVLYTTSAGEQGVARVNMQQRDGRITEIYVGDDLYSPGLCN
jgi:hypothetical protein